MPQDLQPVYTALLAHDWLVAGALVVPFLVALSKQGWFSRWLAAHLPARVIPLFAVLVGALTVGSADVLSGKAWTQAIIDTLFAGFIAVFGHEAIVEGARDGKEIIPERAPKEPPAPPAPPSAPTAVALQTPAPISSDPTVPGGQIIDPGAV